MYWMEIFHCFTYSLHSHFCVCYFSLFPFFPFLIVFSFLPVICLHRPISLRQDQDWLVNIPQDSESPAASWIAEPAGDEDHPRGGGEGTGHGPHGGSPDWVRSVGLMRLCERVCSLTWFACTCVCSFGWRYFYNACTLVDVCESENLFPWLCFRHRQ